MPIGVLIALIALLGGGGGASIAANSSLPGDTLYPVKVGINEKVAKVFQFSDSAKAAFESKLAETRLDEAAKLAAENKLSADWKNKLEADFKAHADAAEKNMEDVKLSGNAAEASSLANELASELKARHDIMEHLKEADKIEVDSEIKDAEDIRDNADQQEKKDSEDKQGTKESADGKISAASNEIDSVKDYLSKASLTANEKADAEEKLKEAEDELAKAKAEFADGKYGDAFDDAKDALHTAEEARISGEVNDELEIDVEKAPGRNESPANPARGGEDKEGVSTGAKAEGDVNAKVGD